MSSLSNKKLKCVVRRQNENFLKIETQFLKSEKHPNVFYWTLLHTRIVILVKEDPDIVIRLSTVII